jgi:hypothetical protein
VYECRDRRCQAIAVSLIDRGEGEMNYLREDAFMAGYRDGLRYDAKGEGIPCGAGWIAPGKKCSRNKAGKTPKKALSKVTERKRGTLRKRSERRAALAEKMAGDWDKVSKNKKLPTAKRRRAKQRAIANKREAAEITAKLQRQR